ncbi:hypothetical protein J5N97_015154 [Dioscorea zingiberensis]|uniref:Outer envelope pore protein 37, chloroplastic n=1 Tax=Dioscorea zingiberensis TaxID=325984 RepID=A0A9D5HK71_9LILI|nr:hypothetical protein J5N97_015154 [Dioscorea zingiberensis]
MGQPEAIPPNPNPISPSTTPPALLEPPPQRQGGGGLLKFPRPAVRVTSEFDSETEVWFHKVSCRLFDRLAKLKLSFQNDQRGQVSSPQIGFLAKNLSIIYDVESQNALLKGSLDLAGCLQLRATHDVKDQQGEVALTANLTDPSYKFELASAFPFNGLPRATLRFPKGELSVEEKENEEAQKVLSWSGIFKSQILNGVCTALYKENDLNLRYCYKDGEMSFIPSICLPSNALSFAFKRQFTPSDKLSYWYHLNSDEWSAVYKHTMGKNLKFKAGYDSEVRLGWASLWIGDEEGKTKTAPMKVKVQFMVQVPRDDINNSLFMFRVKKRWDI